MPATVLSHEKKALFSPLALPPLILAVVVAVVVAMVVAVVLLLNIDSGDHPLRNPSSWNLLRS